MRYRRGIVNIVFAATVLVVVEAKFDAGFSSSASVNF